MKAGVLFSGGKDSTFAAYFAKKSESLECLITLAPQSMDSFMFHYPNIEWTALQAEAMSIPQVTVRTRGIKEVELDDLVEAIKIAMNKFDIERVYSGALASVYQKSRVDRICRELGLESMAPFWQVDPETHLKNLLTCGFEVVLTSVSALGFDETWLGRKLDERMIEDLTRLHAKYGVHSGLEGGEGETFVTNCPVFMRRIEIVESEKYWSGTSGYLRIKKAKLA